MKREPYFWSDPHFGHANILTFKTGFDLIRPGFKDVDHMDQTMIDNYNKTVPPNGKCYWLGDVAMNAKAMHRCLPQMHGEKVLILGNHDTFKPDEYLKYFKKIYSWRYFGEFPIKFVACHYPLHPSAYDYRAGGVKKFMVHGHIHEKVVMRHGVGGHKPDLEYICLCVEQPNVNYTPVHIDELQKVMRVRAEMMNWTV
jgi:calcineurin-like phosphoesterase family protein